MMGLAVRTLDAGVIARHLNDLAGLRIAVFREWPYLYDGDADYEAEYLAHFAQASDALLVAAFDGETIVGMATASPMAAQSDEIRGPVAAAGLQVDRIAYFGESVLLPRYRGRGVGHAFFDRREAGMRAAGADTAMFCSVIRPPDHPRRPVNARSHYDFWTGRGYREVSALICRMTWRDIGAPQRAPHELQFWSKQL